MENEIILFENQEVKLEVNMKDETVWLSLEQMAKLFDRNRTVVTRHINNIFKEKELNKKEVCAKFAHTTIHGSLANKMQTRALDYYNLDVIISVGYRVKSKNGILFRRWANKVLKDYLIKGYAINQKRLKYLEKTVKLLNIANRIDDDAQDGDAKLVLDVVNQYSKALDLLDDYDHKTVKKVKGINSKEKITYEDALALIHMLKFNQESELFALERNCGLKSIINNIYLTFDGKDVYESIEEKAANLLYLVIKNHVFIDGNKRIAATLFICFLHFYDILYKGDEKRINNNTLAAITLMIALSNSKEKEMMVDLIVNFLV